MNYLKFEVLFSKILYQGPVVKLYNTFFLVVKGAAALTISLKQYNLSSVLIIVSFILMVLHCINTYRIARKQNMSQILIGILFLVDLLCLPLLIVPLTVVEN